MNTTAAGNGAVLRSDSAGLRTRPTGTPFGRTSVAFSTGPKLGLRLNEKAAPKKRRAAAYGVSQHSIAEGVAEGSQVRHSSQHYRVGESAR